MGHAKKPGRASGSLVIRFGLVTVPVAVYSGTEDSGVKRSRYSPAGNKISMRNVDSVTGEEIPYPDLVLRYETEDGSLVELTDDEIAAVVGAEGGAADIEAFLPMGLLGAYHQEGLMQVRPANGKKGGPSLSAKAFVLLMDAMIAEDVFALVRYTLRGKPRIAALTPDGFMRVLAFEDEVREPLEMPEATVTDAELEMARKLVAALMKGEPVGIEDEGSAKVRAYAEEKAKTGESIPSEESGKAAPVEDLMAALSASVEATAGS